MKPIQLLAFVGRAASVAYALADPIGLPQEDDAILQMGQVEAHSTITLYTTVFATACGHGVNCTATRSSAVVTSIVEVTRTVCPFTSSATGIPSGVPSSTGAHTHSTPPTTSGAPYVPPANASTSGTSPHATEGLSTTYITSVLTESVTSVITIPGSGKSSIFPINPTRSSSNSSVVGPTSSQYVVLPPVQTGPSGSPLPSGNATWPSPTLTPGPISDASKFGGKASTVAVVVAFAVAFDSKWLPLILCVGNVAAQIPLKEAPSDIRDLIANPNLVSLPIVHVMAVFALFVIMHWIRFMLTRFEPPHNAEREQAVVDIVSGRDDSDEEVNYFTAMHYKIVENQLAEASHCH